LSDILGITIEQAAEQSNIPTEIYRSLPIVFCNFAINVLQANSRKLEPKRTITQVYSEKIK